MSKKGFTLAEVLITLGVIGVVAAMTMPTVIEHHQKQIVVSRMKKFYSTFNQALQMSVNEFGDMRTWTFPTNIYDSAGSNVFWETYLKPHVRYINVKQNKVTPWPTSGVLVYQPDGSAFNLSGTWVTFYPVADKDKNPTRDIFIFTINSDKNQLLPLGHDITNYNTLKSHVFGCAKNKYADSVRYCAEIIMRNGWQISDDYPW